jgi:hypothetical protein
MWTLEKRKEELEVVPVPGKSISSSRVENERLVEPEKTQTEKCEFSLPKRKFWRISQWRRIESLK